MREFTVFYPRFNNRQHNTLHERYCESSSRIIGNLNRFFCKVKTKPNLLFPRQTSHKIKGQTQATRKNLFLLLITCFHLLLKFRFTG